MHARGGDDDGAFAAREHGLEQACEQKVADVVHAHRLLEPVPRPRRHLCLPRGRHARVEAEHVQRRRLGAERSRKAADRLKVRQVAHHRCSSARQRHRLCGCFGCSTAGTAGKRHGCASLAQRPCAIAPLVAIAESESDGFDAERSTDELIEVLDKTLQKDGLAHPGDKLVLLMGAPTYKMGKTNLMLVYRVGSWPGLETTYTLDDEDE